MKKRVLGGENLLNFGVVMSARRVFFAAKLKFWASVASVLAVLSTSALSMTLQQAIGTAVRENPEILESISNREGVEFELEQALGLRRPRVDFEGSIGGELRNSPSTRAAGTDDKLFLRKQASLVARQTLYDGGEARSEIERQASRVDAASYRIRERSEFIALAVAKEYFEIVRLRRMLAISADNIAYHRRILGEISSGAGDGALSISDKQQAQERIFAAKARVEELKGDLKEAEARFIRLVGKPVGDTTDPKNTGSLIPSSVKSALQKARSNHPSVRFARADVDTAAALVRAAESKMGPKVAVEGRAIASHDVGGISGFDGDLQANVVVNWNLYNGGIDKANIQEQIRHVDEAYHRMHRITREVEEGVRLSWDRHLQETKRLRELLRERAAIEELRASYKEQFQIGERSLLDLLDTQNTSYAVQLSVVTADTAVKFGHYRILAASGSLLKTLGVSVSTKARTFGKQKYNVPEVQSLDEFSRTEPAAGQE
jgi:outer membrane protein, adhesin transport system